VRALLAFVALLAGACVPDDLAVSLAWVAMTLLVVACGWLMLRSEGR
jgi:hypothetical protein